MKLDKKLKKLIDNIVKGSLTLKGEIKSDAVKNFTKSLSKLPRSAAIPALTQYSKKLKNHKRFHILEIESADNLDELTTKKIINAFKADYHITDVKTKLNSKLLGGIRVKLGDSVFEDTVWNKIEQLKEEITR